MHGGGAPWAPTLGMFLRSFTDGHVLQQNAVHRRFRERRMATRATLRPEPGRPVLGHSRRRQERASRAAR